MINKEIKNSEYESYENYNNEKNFLHNQLDFSNEKPILIHVKTLDSYLCQSFLLLTLHCHIVQSLLLRIFGKNRQYKYTI